MKYRQLGRSGLRVSPICLGTMNFGGPTPDAEAMQLLDLCRDAGVNFVDTANVYNGGASEEILGRAIQRDRGNWVVATKVNGAWGKGPNDRGSSRKSIIEAAKQSLTRLGTDYIDVYYLHREDIAVPLAESVHAIADLQRAGHIRYFALSNHKAWRVAEVCNICDDLGIDRPVASQPYYNALKRTPEVEQMAACGFYGLGVVPYSPLARGVLSGKYDPAAPPPSDSRAGRQDRRMLEAEWRPESLEIARQLGAHAAARGLSLGQFATAWVLRNPFVTSVIAGPRTVAQLDDYVRATEVTLNAEDEAAVDALVAPGHNAVHGFIDPAEPIEGRPEP